MATAVKDQLFRLIKSLNKAEKRNFKLYARRSHNQEDSLYIRLFDLLARLDSPDDEAVLRRLRLTPGKYSNLKRHLYNQLLTSLRLIYIDKEIDIELREQIDFAHILYGKGLYLDSLRILERAKARAVEHSRDLLHLEILEFQKLIEARHVTFSRQVENKMDLLVNESARRSYSVLNTSELFNINIQIHGRFIESGHSRNAAERRAAEEFWHDIQTPHIDRTTATHTFHQKINRFQAAMWYHHIQLDFAAALENALQALNLFKVNRAMTVKDPDLYLRSLYYTITFGYLTDDQPLMARRLRELQTFLSDGNVKLNPNSQNIGLIYAYLSEVNDRFAVQDWVGARAVSERVRSEYERPDAPFRPNHNRWSLFLYKEAVGRFMTGDLDGALGNLNEVLSYPGSILSPELLLNVRLLMAVIFYETDNSTLLDYSLTNISRQLRKSRSDAKAYRAVLAALRQLNRSLPQDRTAIFEQLTQLLDRLESKPYERKALLNFDGRRWAERHLRGSLARRPATDVPFRA